MLKYLLSPANENLFKRFYSIRWCLLDGSSTKDQRSLISDTLSDLISPFSGPNSAATLSPFSSTSPPADLQIKLHAEAFVGLLEGLFRTLSEQCDFTYQILS